MGRKGSVKKVGIFSGLVFFVSFRSLSHTAAETIFVSPGESIQTAIASAQPGDTVHIGAGVYIESVLVTNSGSAEGVITVEFDPDAVLFSPDPSLSLEAFDFQGAGYMVVRGLEATGGFDEAIFIRRGSHHISLEDCDSHSNVTGIWVAGPDTHDITIRNCRVSANSRVGVRVGPDVRQILVEDVISTFNSDDLGCGGDGDGFVVRVNSSDVTFRNCVADNNSEDGIDSFGTSVTLEDFWATGNCNGAKVRNLTNIRNAVLSKNRSSGLLPSGKTAVENSVIGNNGFINVQLKNGLLDMHGTSVFTNNPLIHLLDWFQGTTLNLDFNLYWNPEPAQIWVALQAFGSGPQTSWTGKDVIFGEWSAQAGQDFSSIVADPDHVPDAEGICTERNRLDACRCRWTIGREGGRFVRLQQAARARCLSQQLSGMLPSEVNCRALGPGSGDEQTDALLLKAAERLRRGVTRPCTGTILENLGFPGLCSDSTGVPFSMADLHDCLRASHETAVDLAIMAEFPNPPASLTQEELMCQRVIGEAGGKFVIAQQKARQLCLRKQFTHGLVDTADCRTRETGDSSIDARMARAVDDLSNRLIESCTGVTLENLGFPGVCQDATGGSFDLGDLRACILDTHEGKAKGMIAFEFPLSAGN